MLRSIRSLLALAFIAGFMAGCGSFVGQPVAQGPNATRAEVYSTIGEARAQTVLLLKANKMSSADGQKIRTNLQIAEDAVDASAGMTGSAADDKLAIARTAIQVVRSTLLTYGATLK